MMSVFVPELLYTQGDCLGYFAINVEPVLFDHEVWNWSMVTVIRSFLRDEAMLFSLHTSHDLSSNILLHQLIHRRFSIEWFVNRIFSLSDLIRHDIITTSQRRLTDCTADVISA